MEKKSLILILIAIQFIHIEAHLIGPPATIWSHPQLVTNRSSLPSTFNKHRFYENSPKKPDFQKLALFCPAPFHPGSLALPHHFAPVPLRYRFFVLWILLASAPLCFLYFLLLLLCAPASFAPASLCSGSFLLPLLFASAPFIFLSFLLWLLCAPASFCSRSFRSGSFLLPLLLASSPFCSLFFLLRLLCAPASFCSRSFLLRFLCAPASFRFFQIVYKPNYVCSFKVSRQC